VALARVTDRAVDQHQDGLHDSPSLWHGLNCAPQQTLFSADNFIIVIGESLSMGRDAMGSACPKSQIRTILT
jgi:hypothetical protein